MSTVSSPTSPGLGWRAASVAVMGSVGAVSRGFLYGLNNVEVTGLNNLLGVLDRRKQQGRERGLLTVCNHVAVYVPLKHLAQDIEHPTMKSQLISAALTIRSFGASCRSNTHSIRPIYDGDSARTTFASKTSTSLSINTRFTMRQSCANTAQLTNLTPRALSTFFTLGQVLPTHRLWHSPQGGLYQPTIAQAVALLSSPNPNKPLPPTYSTDGTDSHPSPAFYASNRHAWLHVFPEACCHQGDEGSLRYFKWGISRLILESNPAPEFIPMFVHGTQNIMPEDRGFPRFLPRVNRDVKVMIGKPTDVDAVFGQYRDKWRQLVKRKSDEELMHGEEATKLRVEVAKAVRDEISKLREKMGFPKEVDETAALADTWTKEPNVRKFKSPVDGSLVNRH